MNRLANLAPSLVQLTVEELKRNYEVRCPSFYSSLSGFKKLRHLSLEIRYVFVCFVSALYNCQKLLVLGLYEYDILEDEIPAKYAPLLSRYALEHLKRKITFRPNRRFAVENFPANLIVPQDDDIYSYTRNMDQSYYMTAN